MISITRTQRAGILDSIETTIAKRFYDPKGPGQRWTEAIANKRTEILDAASEEHFEKSLNDVLKELGTSHVGVFHERLRRATTRMALAATFFKYANGSELRWMFQDVHEDGPAFLGGIRTGDILLKVNGVESIPPENPSFPMGQNAKLLIRRLSGQERTVEISVPDPRSRRHPVIIPKLVSTARLRGDVGLLKVTMFPGAIGIDVAKLMSQAARELECKSLVIDLRGNTGGGVGCLRLMSLVTPDRRGVGYSLTRKRAAVDFDPQRFRQFDRIPATKIGLLPLLVKFAIGDKSIALFTEALGTQRFHGRIALLVNEHSASASEMVAAFARENDLATIVGTRTPGRVVAASSFKVGHGYRLALPVASYRTWAGASLEGVGVEPSVAAQFCPCDARDEQLSSAVNALH